VASRVWSSSVPTPLRFVQLVDPIPINAVRPMPASVPNRADVVRMLMPCARYRTAIMMAVEPTTATASGFSPASMAGSMNFVRASIVIPMPMSANSPRQRATSMTRTEKAIAIAVSGRPRRKSRNSNEAACPGGSIRIMRISSPTSMPAT
jgi:hypothetical protein